MMQMRQWTIGIGGASALVFGVVLAAKVWPQLDLVAVGSRAPAFRAIDLRTGRPTSLADYRLAPSTCLPPKGRYISTRQIGGIWKPCIA